MIRPLTIVTFLMACGSGLYLYQAKHEAQVLDRTIEKTVRDTVAYREQSRLLAAEWTMLNDPETLRRFSDTYLALKTITPSQFTSLADLDSHLPAVQVPVSSPDSEDADPAPIAAIPDSEPQPVVVSTATSPLGVADGAAKAAPRPISLSVAVAPPRPPERKVAIAKLPVPARIARPTGADAAYRPPSAFTPYASASAEAAFRPPAADPVGAARPTGPGDLPAIGQNLNDPQTSDRRVSVAPDPRSTEVRVSEIRPLLPQLRPAGVAAATRHLPVSPVPANVPMIRSASSTASAPVTTQPTAQSPYVGSLLGMAHGSSPPPVPRPTPVSATQWYNAN